MKQPIFIIANLKSCIILCVRKLLKTKEIMAPVIILHQIAVSRNTALEGCQPVRKFTIES